MVSLTINPKGEIALPNELRDRYGMTPETPIRIVETRSGILLVPLTREPMNAELKQQLAEWQALSTESWERFPYEDAEE